MPTEGTPSGRRLRILDGCAGLGGFGAAFRDRGHDVVSIDIDPDFNPTIVADVRTLRHWDLPGPWDWVHFSPPCNEFSTVNWRRPADQDLSIMTHAYRLIENLRPRAWTIENVQGAVNHFLPLLGKPVIKLRAHYFWGRFPSPLLPDKRWTKGYVKHPSGWKHPKPHDHAAKSVIPYAISQALCDALELDVYGSFLEVECDDREHDGWVATASYQSRACDRTFGEYLPREVPA